LTELQITSPITSTFQSLLPYVLKLTWSSAGRICQLNIISLYGRQERRKREELTPKLGNTRVNIWSGNVSIVVVMFGPTPVFSIIVLAEELDGAFL